MAINRRPRRGIIPGTRGGPLTNISFLIVGVRLSQFVQRFELAMCNDIPAPAAFTQVTNIADGEGTDFPAVFNSEGDDFPCSAWEIHDGVIDLTFAGITDAGGTVLIAAWEPVLTSADGIWCAGGFLAAPPV